MSSEAENKALVRRWLTDFWGEKWNPAIVDELAAPEVLLRYSLHPPRRGREELKAFMTGLRRAFPDFKLWSIGALIAEDHNVMVRWELSGTHTGLMFNDLLMGTLPEATGRRMQFTGTTVFYIEQNLIVEEIGLDDGVEALGQLGFIPKAAIPGF